MNTHLQSSSKQRPGTAGYATGQATARSILDAAKTLVIEKGMGAFSMRGLARKLDMSPGNLSYYYATKQNLLEDLLTYVLAPYLAEFERLRQAKAASPKAQLRAVIEYIYDDLGNHETTYFFPELWVLALRDSAANEQMEKMYATYRAVLVDLVKEIRPDLNEQSCEDIGLAISATLEGFTVFVGHARQHQSRAPHTKSLIIEQLLNMVETAERGT